MTAAGRRQSRVVRRTGVTARLGDRDRALLAALARFRLARTRDLTRLYFDGVRADTAAARLRRLFDAGFLEVTAAELHRPNCYRLGPRGRVWAESIGLSVGRVPSGEAAHHLAIVGLWTELASLGRKGEAIRLTLFRPDWEIRGLADRADLVVPDALAELVGGSGDGTATIHLALEVDLGTESIRTLRRKLDAYSAVLASDEGLFGWSDITLVVVADAPTPSRRQALEQLLESRCPVDWMLWPLGTALATLLEQPMAEPASLPLQPPLAVRGGTRG